MWTSYAVQFLVGSRKTFKIGLTVFILVFLMTNPALLSVQTRKSSKASILVFDDDFHSGCRYIAYSQAGDQRIRSTVTPLIITTGFKTS